MTTQNSTNKPPTTTASKDTAIDPLRSRILNELRAHYPKAQKDSLLIAAKNFAFLTRHYAGADIEPTRVSVPKIDVKLDETTVAYKMALVVHEKEGKVRSLLQHSSPEGHANCLMNCLGEMAEFAILAILDQEGERQRPVYDVKGNGIC